MTPPQGAAAIGAIWYKTILQNASCSNSTVKPRGFDRGRDALNWAVVLPAESSGMQVKVTSNGEILQTVNVKAGLNHGSPDGMRAGEQKLELLDARGMVVMMASSGVHVSSVCQDGILNMNYHVVGLS